MNKSEQIAQILGIQSTDVIVTNNSEARLKDRELTEAERELIADVFLSEEKKEIKALRAEIDQRINGIADIIESGKQGKELADEIRNQNRRT